MIDDSTKDRDLAWRTAWYAEARGRDMTLAALPAFLSKLAEQDHSYSSICYATAAAALAAATAIDHSPRGGLTGFQAGAIMWEFTTAWLSIQGPSRMLRYEHMLYPQHEHDFARSIPRSTWDWIRGRARDLLEQREDQSHTAGSVLAHWRSIVEGVVPFGYSVSEEQ